MAVQANLLPSHSVKTLGAMKAERTVKRITFNPTEANPGNTLYVSVPKLNEEEVIVPGTLSLLFNLDLTGGHANTSLVQNVSRALVDRFVVKYAGTTVQDTNGYDFYKIFNDLFLSTDEREEMLLEGVQSTNLNKVRSNSGDKPTSGVDTELKLEAIYKNKYKINLDHQILTDLRSMADTTMHGNGQRLVNTQDGIQLTLEKNTTGSGIVKCHIFSISDSQMNIMNKQLQSVQF